MINPLHHVANTVSSPRKATCVWIFRLVQRVSPICFVEYKLRNRYGVRGVWNVNKSAYRSVLSAPSKIQSNYLTERKLWHPCWRCKHHYCGVSPMSISGVIGRTQMLSIRKMDVGESKRVPLYIMQGSEKRAQEWNI